MTTREVLGMSKKGISALEEFIKKPVEKVISATKEGKEWKIVAEVLERRSVPDTQDIVARYEVRLDKKGEMLGFKQVMLKRRQDFPEETE